MMVSYSRINGSDCTSANSMPSVMNLITVSRVVWSLKRTLQPTSRPHVTFNSSATRFETDNAATRRGCVQAIRPLKPPPAAKQIFGICVVLPDPVSPAIMTTEFARNASTISPERALMGSSGGNSIRNGNGFWSGTDWKQGRNVITSPFMAGKIDRPPPLPAETFARVLQLASFDGRILVALAGTFSFFAALDHNGIGTVCGVMAAGMGVFELHGTNRLRQGFIDGLNWIIASQIGLMLTIFAYVGWRIAEFDVNTFMNTLPPDVMAQMEAQIRAQGLPLSELPRALSIVNVMLYSLPALIALLYQGGRALYYHRRRGACEALLDVKG